MSGDQVMRPGLKFKVEGTPLERLDFLSLMLALFLGTAALPHILIRYYTVPNPASARKSTIVAIAAIGFFYVLTLFMGLGAMINGVINPADSNMSAPLLARVVRRAPVRGHLGHRLRDRAGHRERPDRGGLRRRRPRPASTASSSFKMDDRQKVRAGKISAFVIGGIAIVLGILFQGMNVTFLVGLAFAVAASANLPAIVMLLFWKRTTAKGIAASIFVGIVSSLTLIALSPDLFKLYGLDPARRALPAQQPGHRLDPVELHHAGRGLAADAEAGAGDGVARP